MSEDQMKKEDQLFIHLVNTFVQSAWISLGKVKSPVSEELERNLEQATYYIDLLYWYKNYFLWLHNVFFAKR